MTTREIENCIYDLERKHHVACRMLWQAEDAFSKDPTDENKDIIDATRRAVFNVEEELRCFMYQEWELKRVPPISPITDEIKHVSYEPEQMGYDK